MSSGTHYENIKFALSDKICSFVKSAVQDPQLPSDLRLKLYVVLEKNDGIGFSLLNDAHSHLRANSLQHVDPLWRLVIPSELQIPSPVVPERNPFVQKRIEQLSTKFENLEYRKMTPTLSPLGKCSNKNASLCSELQCLNRQLLMVINFVLVVVCSFVFGYFVCDMIGTTDVSFFQRVAIGLTLSVIVFFADFYFLVKNVDSCDSSSLKREGKPFLT